MGPGATRVVVSARQRAILERLVRTKTIEQQVAERCRMVLLAAEGVSNAEQGARLDVDRQRVRRWRDRWAAAEAALSNAEEEGADDDDLEVLIRHVVSDEPRSGAPPKFSPEQIVAIIAIACEPPADSDLPISHWTPSELAREAIKRGIVQSISARQVDRFLARRPSGRTSRSTG